MICNWFSLARSSAFFTVGRWRHCLRPTDSQHQFAMFVIWRPTPYCRTTLLPRRTPSAAGWLGWLGVSGGSAVVTRRTWSECGTALSWPSASASISFSIVAGTAASLTASTSSAKSSPRVWSILRSIVVKIIKSDQTIYFCFAAQMLGYYTRKIQETLVNTYTPCLKKNCATVIFWITPWNIGRC